MRKDRRGRRRRSRDEEREGGERTQKNHKTKAVLDDGKDCEYDLILFLFHLILTHSAGKIHHRCATAHDQRNGVPIDER